jgi:hypothetical protein
VGTGALAFVAVMSPPADTDETSWPNLLRHFHRGLLWLHCILQYQGDSPPATGGSA